MKVIKCLSLFAFAVCFVVVVESPAQKVDTISHSYRVVEIEIFTIRSGIEFPTGNLGKIRTS